MQRLVELAEVREGVLQQLQCLEAAKMGMAEQKLAEQARLGNDLNVRLQAACAALDVSAGMALFGNSLKACFRLACIAGDRCLYASKCVSVHCSTGLRSQLQSHHDSASPRGSQYGTCVSFRVQVSAGYSKLLLFGGAKGAGKWRSVGAYVNVCGQSQKNFEAAFWQFFLHLKEVALRTGTCWLHRLCLN